MKIRFWRKDELVAGPKLTSECEHVWSNWSDPGQCRVLITSWMAPGSNTERDGWAQDRHCLLCNIYERRCA